jgi:hypothetical protein
MAGVLAGQALAEAAPAVGLDLEQLADVVEQAPGIEPVEVDGIGQPGVGLRLGPAQGGRPLGDGDRVLDEADPVGLREEREGHCLHVLDRLPAAAPAGQDEGLDDLGPEPRVADPGELAREQGLDVFFADHLGPPEGQRYHLGPRFSRD